MEWMPEDMWFTHLTLGEAAGDLDYDLSAGTEERSPSLRDAGLSFASIDRADEAVEPRSPISGDGYTATLAWIGVAFGVGLLGVAGGLAWSQARR
jgi:hypothetical protein